MDNAIAACRGNMLNRVNTNNKLRDARTGPRRMEFVLVDIGDEPYIVDRA